MLRLHEISRREISRLKQWPLGSTISYGLDDMTPMGIIRYQKEVLRVMGEQIPDDLSEIFEAELQLALERGFDTPLIVSGLGIDRQTRNYDKDVKGEGYSIDALDHPQGIKLPEKPYVVWAKDGSRFRGMSHAEMTNALAPDERSLTFPELLALSRAHPEVFFPEWREYNNFGHIIASGQRILGINGYPVVYHNFFDNAGFGELQIDVLNDVSADYPFRPNLGWPTCLVTQS